MSDGKNTINVTSVILNHVDKKNILILKKPYKLTKLLKIEDSKIDNDKGHYLIIENKRIRNWKRLTIKDNTDLILDLNINLISKYQEINVIYFFNAMLGPLFHKLFKIQLQKKERLFISRKIAS